MTLPSLPRRRRPILPSRVRLLWVLPTAAYVLAFGAPDGVVDMPRPAAASVAQ